MKLLKNITIGLLSVFVISTTSCSEDFLNTTSTESIPSVSVTNSVEGLYVALNGIHRKMVSQDLGIQALGGEPGFMMARDAHGDDFTWATNSWLQTNLQWAINKNNTSAYNAANWRSYYQFILNANMILEALEKVAKPTPESAKKADYIKGECLCIRAWAHFNLVQYYAQAYVQGVVNSQLGVPYRDSSAPINISRNTVEEVYSKINADLDQATTLLVGSSNATTPKLTHYTEKVAWGLKARVALTQQKYTEAASHAMKAIQVATAEGLRLMQKTELNHGFANISTATKDAMYAATTLNDQTVYFYSYYAYMSWNFNSTAVRQGVKCINQATYDKMSTTDLRRTWWDAAGTAAVPTTSYAKAKYQNRKFTARSTSDPVGDVAFMRLSEMYLIAAESYARAGMDTEAKTVFKTFIDQRDPSYADKGNTGVAFADEVVFHRRIELWGEGFRWFDLKRLNLPCQRDGSNFNVAFCSFLNKTQAQADGWYYEIPKVETDNNPLVLPNY